jgi:hypothetical protein
MRPHNPHPHSFIKSRIRKLPISPDSSISTPARIRLWVLSGLLLGVTSAPVLNVKTSLAQNPSAPAGSITNMAPNPGTQANPNHPAPVQRNTMDQNTIDNRNPQALQNQQQQSVQKAKQATTEWPNALPTDRPPAPSNPRPLVPRVAPDHNPANPANTTAPGVNRPAGM